MKLIFTDTQATDVLERFSKILNMRAEEPNPDISDIYLSDPYFKFSRIFIKTLTRNDLLRVPVEYGISCKGGWYLSVVEKAFLVFERGVLEVGVESCYVLDSVLISYNPGQSFHSCIKYMRPRNSLGRLKYMTLERVGVLCEEDTDRVFGDLEVFVSASR